MSHQVLARKWRPRTFEACVGQEPVVRALTHALDAQRIHHAYLLTGTRGVGKTTLARILAKSLNCERGLSAHACGVCAACTEIDAGRFTDYIELDAASNRGVDEMAQLLNAAVYAPTVGRYKVYVIDEVHMLTNHAFNAMLKTLEEPPPHVVFILATTDPQKVPVTVLSRCMQFNLKNMSVAAITDHLAQLLKDEGVAFDDEALKLIGRAGAGSMRDALSIADQAIAHGAGSIRSAQVAQMLGTVAGDALGQLLDHVLAGQAAGALELVQTLDQDGVSLELTLSGLAALLHRIALTQAGAPGESEFDETRLRQWAQQVAPEALQVLYQIAIHGVRDLSLAPDAYTGLSMTVLRMLAFLPQTEQAKPARAPTTPESPGNGEGQAKHEGQAEHEGEPAGTEPAPVRQFDGNWPRLAAALPLSGMARQLATQSELVAAQGDQFHLRVALKPLADPANVSKLKEALTQYFGRLKRVQVEIGVIGGTTAASQAQAQRAARTQSAQEAVDADPFVQSIVKEFGAVVVPGSVEAIDLPGGEPPTP